MWHGAGRVSAPSQFGAEMDAHGRFVRQRSAFRGGINTSGGGADPVRYHLYVSLACPWAHRVVIARVLKGLDRALGMTVVDPIRDERGWAFRPDPDPLTGFDFLAQAYRRTEPAWEGRVTVPVLWNIPEGRIVNNESEDILRILDGAFGGHARATPCLRPPELAASIDEVNGVVYPLLNDGVYRAGFATTQQAYDAAAACVAEGLLHVERILRDHRWLVGNVFTEADIRLFTTLVRFDAVYHTHFKCNARLVGDSEALLGYLRDIAQVPGVMGTIDMDQIKRHYYLTHDKLNPVGIVPVSDGPDLTRPHGRGSLGPEALG